jgi:hypothetical protein
MAAHLRLDRRRARRSGLKSNEGGAAGNPLRGFDSVFPLQASVRAKYGGQNIPGPQRVTAPTHDGIVHSFVRMLDSHRGSARGIGN